MRLFFAPLMIGLTSATMAAAAPDLQNLDAASCDQYLEIKSTLYDTPLENVSFVNETDGTRTIAWINYEGGVVHYSTLASGETFVVNTFETHPWLIVDDDGKCREMFLLGIPGETVKITK